MPGDIQQEWLPLMGYQARGGEILLSELLVEVRYLVHYHLLEGVHGGQGVGEREGAGLAPEELD